MVAGVDAKITAAAMPEKKEKGKFEFSLPPPSLLSN
jgi:hypothetical protein